MSFWEKVNTSLDVPCTRRDTKKCIPLARREDKRGAVRGHEKVTFVEICVEFHRKTFFHNLTMR